MMRGPVMLTVVDGRTMPFYQVRDETYTTYVDVAEASRPAQQVLR